MPSMNPPALPAAVGAIGPPRSDGAAKAMTARNPVIAAGLRSPAPVPAAEPKKVPAARERPAGVQSRDASARKNSRSGFEGDIEILTELFDSTTGEDQPGR